MKIFTSFANAVWNEMLPFDSVYPAAQVILKTQPANRDDILKVATIMSRLSRKFENTDSLGLYLQAGLEALAGSKADDLKESQFFLLSEHALQIKHDTAQAIKIRRDGLGPNWQNIPQQFYKYAKWCLECKVDLTAAEYFAKRAADVAPEGEFKASVLNTLAEICFELGEKDKAVQYGLEALANHPENRFYVKQLEKFRGQGK